MFSAIKFKFPFVALLVILLIIAPSGFYSRILTETRVTFTRDWTIFAHYGTENSEACDEESPVISVNIIKESAYNRPCCISPSEGEIECFTTGTNANIEHASIRISPSQTNIQWEDLGGTQWNGIECATNGETERYDVIMLSTAQQMMKRSHTLNGWSDWEELVVDGRTFIDAPSCLYTATERMDCVTRGSDNYAYNQWAISGSWVGNREAEISDELVTPIALVSRKPQHSDCFAVKAYTSNELHYSWNHFDVWYPWYNLGSWWKGRPVLTANATRVDIFGLGERNQLKQKTWTPETYWLPTQDLGGAFLSTPECISRPDPYSIWCFAVGKHSILHRNVLSNDIWSGWQVDCAIREINFLEAPSCVFSAQNEVSCYARNSLTEIVEIVYATEVIYPIVQ